MIGRHPVRVQGRAERRAEPVLDCLCDEESGLQEMAFDSSLEEKGTVSQQGNKTVTRDCSDISAIPRRFQR